MTRLEKLRAAKTLHDLAPILGFMPKGLSYVLYHVPSILKYTEFDIPKRDGGVRRISVPEPKLALLQKRLADLLYDCIDELNKESPKRLYFSHGFARSHSIVTNASVHKSRRYVFNIDIEDFFGSINFGRVRGFFIKDRHFQFDATVATIIAQITCHNNKLPQGSPSSPVISNLIGHILDVRLAGFARVYQCTYSRYADDITFSTNRLDFPAKVAELVPGSKNQWQAGEYLRNLIERSGFSINLQKTRMQIRGSRQVVTGLMVNKKVNIRPEYYRSARAMCHSLFSKGFYYRQKGFESSDNPSPILEFYNELACLEGILGHVYHVKNYSDRRTQLEKMKYSSAIRALYRKFLFFKRFVVLEKPIILTEGKTDVLYLKSAIEVLPIYRDRFGTISDSRFRINIDFLNYSHTVHAVLQLGGGTGDLKQFIKDYAIQMQSYKYKPLSNPVIVLVDNDEGSKDIFSLVNRIAKCKIDMKTKDQFYHITHNLYLAKTPENGKDGTSYIEQLFDPQILSTVIDGRSFDPSLKVNKDSCYGKMIFAEKVVRPNRKTIDFSGFSPLLDRIDAIISDYYSNRIENISATAS